MRKNSIVKIYKENWDYLRRCKNYVFFIVVVFLIFCFLGFFKLIPGVLIEFIENYLKEILKETAGMSGGELIFFIFQNNLKSGFFALLFGLVLGIFPFLSAVLNGYVLGFVVSKSVPVLGFLSLLRLLPHGIFELPAIIISMALGVKLGMFVFYGGKKEYVVENLYSSLKVFVFIVLPLLILAAVIEGLLIAFF